MRNGGLRWHWDSAVGHAIVILRECAAEPGYITYGDLAVRLKSFGIKSSGWAMNNLLAEVSRREMGAARPLLSAIVLTKENRKPGRGFYELARWLGFRFVDPHAFWAAEHKKTTEYWRARKSCE